MLISGGHDGSVRAWDLRTFHFIFDVIAHRRKYDEGVLALAACDKYPIIASGIFIIYNLIVLIGGADSLIKIMHE